jgi:protein TonB
MERALANPPGLQLDAKRIAATSVAILVHAAVLMLLLMPIARREEPVTEERDIVVVPQIKLQPVLPPPIAQPTHRVVEHAPRVPAPPSNPPVDAVNDAPSPIDLYVPPQVEAPPTDVGPVSAAPVFAAIAADIAPVPPYPKQALIRRIAGQVVLRIRVDVQGRPVEVSIESSSGSRLLDEAAAKFVQARWHFVPAMQGGQPVEALALLPVNFALPH